MLKELAKKRFISQRTIKLQKNPSTKPIVTFYQTQKNFNILKSSTKTTDTLNQCFSSDNIFNSHNTINSTQCQVFSQYPNSKNRQISLKELSCLSTKDTFKSTSLFTDFNLSSKQICSSNRKNKNQKKTYSSNDNQQILNDINNNLIIPMKKKSINKRDYSMDISNSVQNLQYHLRCASDELNRINNSNNNLKIETSIFELATKATKINNKFIKFDFPKIQKDITDIIRQKSKLEKETVIFKNITESIKNQIDEMKSEIKHYKQLIQEVENYKKNMQSAWILIKKRNGELKMQLSNLSDNNDNIGKELLYLYNKYKLKEEIFI